MDFRKKILIVTNRYPGGPDDVASPFVYDFRRALEQVEITVDIVTPYYEAYRNNNDYLDMNVHLFPWSDGTKVISHLSLYNPTTFFKIKRYFQNGYRMAEQLINRQKYDGLLALWAAPSGYIARKLARKYDLPYAVWALGSDINSWANMPAVGRIIRQVLSDADILYADGYELATKVQKLVDRKCNFIPSFHALDIDGIRPEMPDRTFVCIGRVEESKGVFDLLNAFKAFAPEHPDWKLIYVGTGRAADELKKQIEVLNLRPAVEYRGYLPRQEINDLLIRAHTAVIPSRADSLPLTFGEAMQAGVPVICSDIGDMPFLIDTHKVGIHYPAGNIERLTDCLKTMAESDENYSENCMAVSRELNITNAAQAIIEWIDPTLKKGERERSLQHADA